jgi:phosphatidylglycerol:prolipoprotein diacylglycerol transferase
VFPFVGIDDTKIAPFHPYGICVAIGFFVGDWAMMRFAVKRGYERSDFRMLVIFMGVFGWLFAWGVDILFYRTEHGQGVSLFQGFSSTGAIVGAVLAAFMWSRFDFRGWKAKKRAEPQPMLPASEVVQAAWPLAFAFGRLGCSLIHDHVGAPAVPGTLGSLFAIAFPRGDGDGVDHALGPIHVITGGSDLRYDLGFLELWVLVPLSIWCVLTWKKKVQMGTFTIVSCLWYGPWRFFLDFLRAEDGPSGEARQGGLTFAQYFSIAIVALGIVLLVRRRRAREVEAASSPS